MEELDEKLLSTNIKHRKYTVLIVDDYPMNTILAESYVSHLFPNSIIITAKDGKEAVESYLKHNPNIIIMDIQMPVMSGYEATIKIREIEAGIDKHTPIVALTAGTAIGDKEKCLKSGMDDFMTKPIVLSTFENILIKHLSLQNKQIGNDSLMKTFVHFNKEQMMERVMQNIDLYNKMINMALVTLPENIQILSKAYEAKYLDAVRFNAHSIKGIALDSSFNILAEYASELAHLEDNTNEENLKLIKLIEEELHLIKEEIAVNS
ncbi:MAG: response regulator [Bacteroidota bacterium]